MVRQTHRRRQTKGRRRNTRRSRRTQRGGGIFDFLSFGSSNIEDLKKKLADATDPKEKAEIQKKIELANLEIKYNEDKKMIENGTSTAAATEGAASSVSSNSSASSQSPYNSPASQASTGAGQMSASGAIIGGRRRSRRYRRK
jgi:hypothetical protein